MKTECSLGELLYIGIVAEKGRCYGVRWNTSYRNILRIHLIELRKICLLLYDASNIESVLNNFAVVCENEDEIGKFYSVSNWKYVEKWDDIEVFHPIILQLMSILLDEVIEEVNKMFVNKKKVYILLNCLHNLPRVYFDEKEETLCNLKCLPISEEEALSYVFQNANDDVKKIFGSLNF